MKIGLARRAGACGNGYPGAGRLRGNDGSILMATLFVTGFLAFLSVSYGASVRSQLTLFRLEKDALAAELATHSALQYTARQLALDSNWQGTRGESIQFGEEGMAFEVVRDDEGGPLSLGMPQISVVLTGSQGNAVRRLEASFDLETPNPVVGSTLFLLGGGPVDLDYVDIEGDAVLADAADSSETYREGADGNGVFTVQSPHSAFQLDNVDVSGRLIKANPLADYSGVSTNLVGLEVLHSEPFKMPRWSLEQYLEPGPDLLLYSTAPPALSNLVFEETVVLTLDPGQSIDIQNVEFRGGLVVYINPKTDLTALDRDYEVRFNGSVVGGGQQGKHPSIGMIAPGAHVEADNTVFNGFNFWNSASNLDSVTVNGQLTVVNRFENVNDVTMSFDRRLLHNLPGGIGNDGSHSGLDLIELREFYTDPVVDQGGNGPGLPPLGSG